jgi:ABC-type oligopeptide transport system ATPase subunit
MEKDPRMKAFCSPMGPEVFHAIEHQGDIWREDRFDVPQIHADAREVFGRLLERATTPPGLDAGRILLLLGESGSGKTHLMRAFRNSVHSEGLGYFGYMQMTTASRDYRHYILQKLVDSLQQPYALPLVESSGLKRLSDALASKASFTLGKAIDEGKLEGDALAERIHNASEDVLRKEGFQDIDSNVIRALLYLQTDSVSVHQRINAYLRCEPLSLYDQKLVSCLAPRHQDEEPLHIVAHLGKIMWACHEAALVICADQLEEIVHLGEASDRFPRAMTALTAVIEEVPSSIVVVSCLDGYYKAGRKHLLHSTLDRLERDPEPVHLVTPRSLDEVQKMVALRLQSLYETAEVDFDESDPIYPFPVHLLGQFAGLSTRAVLEACRSFREECCGGPPIVIEPPFDGLLQLTQEWNDFSANWSHSPSEDEAELAAVLAQAIAARAEELGVRSLLRVDLVQGNGIEVDFLGGWKSEGQGPKNLFVAICNKSARGGGLGKQIEALSSGVAGRQPVAVRSTEFPENPKAKIAQQIGEFIARGGLRLVIADADWRGMAAMMEFRKLHGGHAKFTEWLEKERPLAQSPSLAKLLQPDALRKPDRTLEKPKRPPQQHDASTRQISETRQTKLPLGLEREHGPISLGLTSGRSPQPASLDPDSLTRHMAFLGGTGTGKTTAALSVIEGLLLRGVPAILVDRKGDLCSYSRPQAWSEPLEDPAAQKRREQLRKALDVALYTPGNPSGRPLSMSVVPRGLSEMEPHDRDLASRTAAAALAGMMGYGNSQSARQAILKIAIDVLGNEPSAEGLSLQDLVQFLGERDRGLLNAIGLLDVKNIDRLIQDLETLRVNKGALLGSGAEPIDIEALLGLGQHAVPGKTRLSILSTKFLGDPADIEFWVAQLLLEVGRWTSKHPASGGKLQAVLMLDEADLYLPATRQPAPKRPLENLLKRARSAGLCVMLATQSPGELDYRGRDNIRTWLVGAVREPLAQKKLAPMFTDAHADTNDLAGQERGQFHLLAENRVERVRVQRNLIPALQLPEDEIVELAASQASKPIGPVNR